VTLGGAAPQRCDEALHCCCHSERAEASEEPAVRLRGALAMTRVVSAQCARAEAALFLDAYTALKRRPSTLLRAISVGIRVKTNINVKGNGQKFPFHTR